MPPYLILSVLETLTIAVFPSSGFDKTHPTYREEAHTQAHSRTHTNKQQHRLPSRPLSTENAPSERLAPELEQRVSRVPQEEQRSGGTNTGVELEP